MKYLVVGIVLIVIFVGIFLASNTIDFRFGLKHQPSQQVAEDAELRLDTQNRNVELAVPTISEWNSGDDGLYKLFIKSDGSDYSINVYLEQVAGQLAAADITNYQYVSDWFSYPQTTRLKEVSIIVKPKDAEKGIYLFRVVVCKGIGLCDLSSQSLYGSKTFAIEII